MRTAKPHQATGPSPESFVHCQRVIDEADRLQMNSIEQLRSIFDEGFSGIAFIGMPGIESVLLVSLSFTPGCDLSTSVEAAAIAW
jgi:hypothetical protein